MGYISEFNWVLKLKPEQGLDEDNLELNTEYSFNKKDRRIYPLGLPILLVNNDWEAVGTVNVFPAVKSIIGYTSTSGLNCANIH